MRQIKFRGRKIEGGGEVSGEYGVYVFPNGTEMYFIYCGAGSDEHAVAVYPESVMQYTGLKDKNGAEIYEGDRMELSATCFSSSDDPIFAFVKFGKYSNRWDDFPSFGYYLSHEKESNAHLRNDICFWIEKGAKVVGDREETVE